MKTADISGAYRRPLNLRMAAELPEEIEPMLSVEEALDRCLMEMSFTL